ncbi:MAG: cation-translocating P-type ATPase [Erysipelotrichaceae bacterium]|nr:cation-translocating P-type ATPase [Erysipelotrichaceae bacterium]
MLSIFNVKILPFDNAWVAILLCGIPIILEAIIGLITAFDIKADVLVSLALLASIYIGEYFAAGEVAFIMQLGGLLEELTVSKAREGIEKLVQLTPKEARIIDNDKEIFIPAKDVQVGQCIRVLPGQIISVDGRIIEGETSINQAVMTGESLPVDKKSGDEVTSGTVNLYGAFIMEATKIGEDSSIQRMIQLVQDADASKAKIVNLADRWATWIVVIALTASVLTYLVTHEILRSVTILVVFCPCALVLATPTAIMAAIGNATKHGFLVREGDALERLAKVSKVTFDKTGTLTYGQPQVIDVISLNSHYDNKKIMKYAASIEYNSEHPLGKAIVDSYDGDVFDVSDFKMLIALGVSGYIDNQLILAGNQQIMKQHDINIPIDILNQAETYLQKGCNVTYISIKDQLIGYLVLSDIIRQESSLMIKRLKKYKVEPVLLTGDNTYSANTIGKQLGIDTIYANCFPEDKLHCIDNYQKNDEYVCMIGDGINDAPALKKAYVGIAMGGIGSDIAIDAADIALINDDIKELPHLIGLSQKMMFTIKCNLTFSMTLNFIALFLAMTGILNPVVGALVHNCGSVFVIINSALLLRWRKKK